MLTSTILACPACGWAFDRELGGDRVTCGGCHREFPTIGGVPILLRDPTMCGIHHQAELPVRPIYSEWKERLILKALPEDCVALDFGAGRQVFDDPCIVKLDLIFDPTLDLVGDLHELPLRSESIDFAFGGAVMEHIRDPAKAIGELYRILRPGGYVYADWSFLAAYHGYPHHYTNQTIQGIREAFSAFTCLEVGVGPHLGPAFALRSVLATYREHFKPETRLDWEFRYLIDRILWHPLDELDHRIPEADRFRIAAGHYFFGVKQPRGDESILPAAVLAAHRASPDLQRRYPSPLNLALPDNLMEWAYGEGSRTDAGIREALAAIRPFHKGGGVRVPGDRAVRQWPSMLMDRPGQDPVIRAKLSEALWFSRGFWARLRDSWDERGPAGLVRCVLMSVGYWWRRGIRGLRKVGVLPKQV